MAAFSRADAHDVVDVFGRNLFYRRVDQASWSEVEFVSGLLLMIWVPLSRRKPEEYVELL